MQLHQPVHAHILLGPMCIENRIQLIFIQNSHCLKIATKKQCISTRNEPFSGTLFGVANFETLPYDSPSILLILLVSSNFFYSKLWGSTFFYGKLDTVIPWPSCFLKGQPQHTIAAMGFCFCR